MDLGLSAEDRDFRDRLRAFLADNRPPPGDASFEAGRAWQRTLQEGLWVAPHWPTEFGGQGCTLSQYAIFVVELAAIPAPQIANRVGVNMVGSTLLEHGSSEQKERYLRRILCADDIWCQMFSEPDAGSDLRSITTTAIEDGDGYVVNGQKVWSSFGALADFGVLLARSPDGSRRARRLSYFICDMRTPGIEVRPLRQLTGETEFAEVFLTDVRIPNSQLVGGAGEGWRVVSTNLANERGLAYPLKEQTLLSSRLRELLSAVRASDDAPTPWLRHRLADDFIRTELLRFLNLRTLTRLERGNYEVAEGSLTKLVWASTTQHLEETALALAGAAGVAGDDTWTPLLWSRQASIAGGTSEVQRNVIAEQLLQLPRELRGAE